MRRPKVTELSRAKASEMLPPISQNLPDISPRYLIVRLHPTTKKLFMELRKSKHVIANRPIGFIYEYEGVRLIYIAEDNQYYEGHYLDCYTPEMFMERETKGVVTTTEIVFTLGEKAQAA